MENLTKYTKQELSLRVFNDEVLYNHRHQKDFIKQLKIFFKFNDIQLKILKEDLEEDLKEKK